MDETWVREREDIEWSIHYAYGVHHPGKRVLFIGDSICKAYEGPVRERLEGRVNVSFWASSRCVTDPDYVRELDFVLGYVPYDLICFNNGLHSLHTDRDAWRAAYGAVLDRIGRLCPDVMRSVTLNTPLADPELTGRSAELNAIARDAAGERQLPMIDLFAAMDGLDRAVYWSDTFHFTPPAVEMQADVLAAHVLARLDMEDAPRSIPHASTATGPDGPIR